MECRTTRRVTVSEARRLIPGGAFMSEDEIRERLSAVRQLARIAARAVVHGKGQGRLTCLPTPANMRT